MNRIVDNAKIGTVATKEDGIPAKATARVGISDLVVSKLNRADTAARTRDDNVANLVTGAVKNEILYRRKLRFLVG